MSTVGSMQDAADEEIAAVRRFNRFYTRRIDLLNEKLLDSPFTLTQARVLFELGTHEGLSAARLVQTLGLDPGYLSRILQDFADRRLIVRQRAVEDARRSEISLSAKGRKAFESIDRKSRALVGEMIAPLSPIERLGLLAAMRTVEHQLSGPAATGPGAGAAAVAGAAVARTEEIVLRPYRIGDVGWAIERHGVLYADEYGWNGEFEALVATLLARFATEHDPAAERFWVAELGGERLGCVFVVRSDKDRRAAQLRCLLVEPQARGLGIGRRLVDRCLEFAKSAGYAKMILWTNDVLTAARRLYESAGFRLIEESHHRSFGHDLVGQIWSKEL
ncbi:MAG TPA: helix-turn-helix domain-containing GNAT family N-acetyltransferase [Steroidobacteraceae bacterium]|nr:helix-turn-helix domain-containing GNAT family N-acetyltransferase [Steroidobacteraceae bacterium]